MSDRKDILILGNYPPPYGGVPRHIEDLVPYLLENGWHAHILCYGDSGIEKQEGFTVYRQSQNASQKIIGLAGLFSTIGIRKRWSSLRLALSTPFARWVHYMNRARLGSQIIESNDIRVISAYNLISYAPVGVVLSQIYDIPLVVTNFGEIYSDANFINAHKGLVNYICKSASELVSMTNHCAQSYKQIGLTPDVNIIPIGIDVTRFSPSNDGQVIRQRLGLSTAGKVILYVGRMIEDMGLHTLLDAIPALVTDNQVKVIIAGQEGNLLARAKELAVLYKDQIFVTPNISLEDLPLYYAAADIVVVPTQGDRACGSLVAAEAMATAKPVVATNVGGIPEFVINGETGMLVNPEDPEALANAVESLLADQLKANAMGKRGRQRAETVLSKDQSNRQYEQLFRKVAAI